MSERLPIKRATALEHLDGADCIEGYWAGKDGDPEPGNNRSFSYWHGWRNGAADGGHRPIDPAQRELARDVFCKQRGTV
jgi:hypothetical protein